MSLVRISAAARELGVSVETIRKKIRNAEWPSYSLGPRTRLLDLDEIRSLAKRFPEKISKDDNK